VYDILIEFSVHMKLDVVRLIEMCLNATWSEVWVCNNFPGVLAV
jgi:hypothetical protein